MIALTRRQRAIAEQSERKRLKGPASGGPGKGISMEKIKYHDNNIEPQYGPDDRLLDNWNPDLDYGEEYAVVHFRVHTPLYSYPRFSFEPEDRKMFYAETDRIFAGIGWHVLRDERGGHCMEVAKGDSSLYLHPQDFSGTVLKNEVEAVAEALATSKVFSLNWVDVYQTVYTWSDEEYAKLLEERIDIARKEVLKRSRTRRYDYYCLKADIAETAAGFVAPGLRLKNMNLGIGHTDKQTVEFVNSVIADLVEKGYLLEKAFALKCGDFPYIRALNRAEQKMMAKSLAYGDIFCG